MARTPGEEGHRQRGWLRNHEEREQEVGAGHDELGGRRSRNRIDKLYVWAELEAVLNRRQLQGYRICAPVGSMKYWVVITRGILCKIL